MKKTRRHLSSPTTALLVALGLASWGCRARDDVGPAGEGTTLEPSLGAVDVPLPGVQAVPAAAPRVATPGESLVEEGRRARIDARLLDLQAAINQLEVAGADREESASCTGRSSTPGGPRCVARNRASDAR